MSILSRSSNWLREKPSKHTFVLSMVISVIVAVIVIEARRRGYLQYFELKAYDKIMALRPRGPVSEQRVAVVGVDEEDIQEMQRYPLSDGAMAGILERLEDYKPKVIGVDIYRDFDTPPGSDDLNSLFKRDVALSNRSGSLNAPFVYIYFVRQGDPLVNAGKALPVVYPPKALAKTMTLIGTCNLEEDLDGVVRRGLFEYLQNFSMASEMLFWYFPSSPMSFDNRKHPTKVMLDKRVMIRRLLDGDGGYAKTPNWYANIPDWNAGFEFLLDYKNYDQIEATTIHYRDLMSDSPVLQAKIKDQVAGKAVMVGIISKSTKDLISTPLASSEYGVYYHAWIMDQMIRAAKGEPASINIFGPNSERTYIIFWSLLGGAIAYRWRSPWKGGIGIACALFLVSGVAWVAFSRYSYWLPLVPPLMVVLMSHVAVSSYLSYRDREDRAAIQRLLMMNMSADIAKMLINRMDELFDNGRLLPKKAKATILFTDLEDFTAISEGMTPEQLMAWVNKFMSRLTLDVQTHHGAVMKYIGDAIMAGFGVPNIRADNDEQGHREDARAAVMAALSMRKALSEQNADWTKSGRPTARMRIGIFTGPLVSGSVGSASRMEYTCLGDTVNTASRLESFQKHNEGMMDDDIAPQNCRILIGASTLALIGDGFETRLIPDTAIDGKKNPVVIHAVIDGPTGNLSAKPFAAK
jgi:adenylate cyclase